MRNSARDTLKSFRISSVGSSLTMLNPQQVRGMSAGLSRLLYPQPQFLFITWCVKKNMDELDLSMHLSPWEWYAPSHTYNSPTASSPHNNRFLPRSLPCQLHLNHNSLVRWLYSCRFVLIFKVCSIGIRHSKTIATAVWHSRNEESALSLLPYQNIKWQQIK